MRQISGAAEGHFMLQDVHNIGIHYIPTLLAWQDNFIRYWESEDKTAELPEVWGSSETFYRMWCYYLSACAANFATGGSQVWQIVYAKGHLAEGYASER